MHAISSYRGNRPTHPHTYPPTHKQTEAITIPCAAASLARSVIFCTPDRVGAVNRKVVPTNQVFHRPTASASCVFEARIAVVATDFNAALAHVALLTVRRRLRRRTGGAPTSRPGPR